MTATTGTRLIKTDAPEAAIRLIPKLYRPKAPRLTGAPRYRSRISILPFRIGRSFTRGIIPGEKNRAPAKHCIMVRVQGLYLEDSFLMINILAAAQIMAPPSNEFPKMRFSPPDLPALRRVRMTTPEIEIKSPAIPFNRRGSFNMNQAPTVTKRGTKEEITPACEEVVKRRALDSSKK